MFTSGESIERAPEGARPVLVVEDEPALRDLVARTLTFAGFQVRTAESLEEARAVLTEVSPAVAVLDVMLPDGTGFELAQALRFGESALGVLFLTARDTLEDRLTGFAFGADDYLTKPFSVAELVARVTALHRRVTVDAAAPVAAPVAPTATAVATRAARVTVVGDVTLDESSYVVTRAGTALELSPTEFKLLRYLMQNVDIVVSKEQIVEQVWGWEHVGDVGVVEKFVSQLRRKLEGEAFIHTVRGFGYTVRSS